MKDLTFVILLFFSYNFLTAQSGSVIYTVKVDSSAFNTNGVYKERFSKMKKYANSQQFELLFNKTKSSFKIIESIDKSNDFDDFEYTNSRFVMTSASDIYFDSQAKKEIKKEFDGQLTEIFVEKKWKIMNESKEISGYLCYKALLQEPFFDRDGTPKNREVEAWFTPKIAHNFGPKNFYDLPGLILQLHYNKTTFYASKIELFDKEIKINLPKGKTITKEDYDNKLKSQMGM
jgi:GLPGLI family protein